MPQAQTNDIPINEQALSGLTPKQYIKKVRASAPIYVEREIDNWEVAIAYGHLVFWISFLGLGAASGVITFIQTQRVTFSFHWKISAVLALLMAGFLLPEEIVRGMAHVMRLIVRAVTVPKHNANAERELEFYTQIIKDMGSVIMFGIPMFVCLLFLFGVGDFAMTLVTTKQCVWVWHWWLAAGSAAFLSTALVILMERGQ